MSTERSYIAFISYRHKPLDKQAAEMIQRRIERYIVPKEYRDQVGGKRLGMVFRDEDELPASSSLSNSITEALDHSKYLLVICTPDLPLSKWCEQEIRYFLKTHDRDHVLAVLVDGEPEKSFSPYLLHTYDEEGNITGDTEPLAANFAGPDHTISKKAFKKEIVRIYSALIGCPFDALWQRDRRAKTNRLIALLGVIMAVMAVFMGVVLSKNAQITEQNRQITEQNTQILEQSQKISEQNDDLQAQMSTIMVDAGRGQLESFNVKGAVTNGIDALLGDSSSPLVDPRAQKLLADSLGAYRTDEFKSSLIYEQSTDINNMILTEDGAVAVLADQAGTVRAIDSRSGILLWEVSDPNAAGDSMDDSPIDLFSVSDLILCKSTNSVSAHSVSDGSEVWRYDYSLNGGNHFRGISGDGSRLLILDNTKDADAVLSLLILNTADGSIIGQAPVLSEGEEKASASWDPWYNYAGGFSASGKYAAAAVYITSTSGDAGAEEKEYLKIMLFDTENMQQLSRFFVEETELSTNQLIGITVTDAGDIFLPRYCSSYGGIVCSFIRYGSESGEQTLTNHTIKDKTGMVFNVYESLGVVPMIASNRFALVPCENMLYVYELSEGIQRLKSYGFTGNILSARWIDREAEIAEIMTSDGCVARYYFTQEGDGLLESYSAWSYDQSSICCLSPYHLEDNLLFCLTVPADTPSRVLRAESVSDPAGAFFPETPDFQAYSLRVLSSPSGDRIFVFCFTDSLTVAVYDASTFTEIARQEYADTDTKQLSVIDDTHFLCGKKLYDLDGTSEYIEKITDANSGDFRDDALNTIRLSDGRTLTAAHISSTFNLVADPCWIDGKLVNASNDAKTGLCFGTSSFFAPGKNGLIVGLGKCVYTDENGNEVKNDTETFNIFDAVNEKRTILEDRHPETTERLIAIGTEKPVFLCADDTGTLCLYDAEKGTGTDLSFRYAPKEIRHLAFAPGDEYLVVLTRSSRLEVLDIASGELVYSDTPGIINNSLSRYISSSEITADRETGHLYINFRRSSKTIGSLIELDTASWTVLSESEDTYAALPEAGCIVAYRTNDLMHYPIYDLERLSVWAKEYLNS
ncbi:MAG: TIR domain-containing protein [Lachnospiraceae bacterium]|nr:TIR domain-containing protein [Lachnospiraceae bacterium]